MSHARCPSPWTTAVALISLTFALAACGADAPDAAAPNEQAPAVGEDLAARLARYRSEAADTTLSDGERLLRVRYLAEAAYAKRDHVSAYELLLDGVSQFPNAESVPEAGLLMADIAVNGIREPHTAEIIFAQLRERFDGHKALDLIPEEYEVVSMTALQQGMQRAIYPDGTFDPEAAVRYGQASLAYTALEPNADRALRDHLASGTVLEDAGRLPLALQHYRRAARRFAGHSKAGTAAFMEGFVLYELQQDEAAGRAVIERFIADYPEHPLVGDARALLGGTLE